MRGDICTQLFRYLLLYSEPDESEKKRILERVLRGESEGTG